MVSGAVGSSTLVFFDATTVRSPKLTAEASLDGRKHNRWTESENKQSND